MSKISIRRIIREVIESVLSENVGPGPTDTVPVSQIYMDLSNYYLNHDHFPDFDPEAEYDPFRDTDRKIMGKNIFDKEFKSEIEKYRDWKSKTFMPKGRESRKLTKPG